MLNSHLNRAAISKQDEYYTRLYDVEREMRHYKEFFKDKVIYCNCDDPRESAFFHYFAYNFKRLQLKKLITTCYRNTDRDLFSNDSTDKAIYLEYSGTDNELGVPDLNDIEVKDLSMDGDFRSIECIELLKEADIVVTNPPFSLFREYISQLVEYNKKFLILGTHNNITTKDIFRYFADNLVWLGYNNGDMQFRVPAHYEERETRYWVDDTGQKWRSFGNMCWLTNFDIKKRYEDLILYETYSIDKYPNYDDYDAIEVSRVKNIPKDYKGKMGVPITFLNHHNPEQFDVLGIDRYISDNPIPGRRFKINGNEIYARVIIQSKSQ